MIGEETLDGETMSGEEIDNMLEHELEVWEFFVALEFDATKPSKDTDPMKTIGVTANGWASKVLNINCDGVAGGGWALSREGGGLVRWRGGVRKLADFTRTVDFATIVEVARGEIGM